jgi:hypothetical protein
MKMSVSVTCCFICTTPPGHSENCWYLIITRLSTSLLDLTVAVKTCRADLFLFQHVRSCLADKCRYEAGDPSYCSEGKILRFT